MVYPSNSAPDGISLLTANGTSASVQPFELVITLILFLAVYVLLFVGWARVIGRFIGEGPVFDGPVSENAADTDISFKGIVVEDEPDGSLDVQIEDYAATSDAEVLTIEEDVVIPLDETEKGGDE